MVGYVHHFGYHLTTGNVNAVSYNFDFTDINYLLIFIEEAILCHGMATDSPLARTRIFQGLCGERSLNAKKFEFLIFWI